MSLALDLVAQEATALGEPIVALMDSGTQWGPIDGTSAVSAKIDNDFSSPGRVYVAASGDEGILPNHARATYRSTAVAINFNKTSAAPVTFQLWYSDGAPADVTLTMNDTATSVTVSPGNNYASGGNGSIELCTYLPEEQFYPQSDQLLGRSDAISVQSDQGGQGLLWPAQRHQRRCSNRRRRGGAAVADEP